MRTRPFVHASAVMAFFLFASLAAFGKNPAKLAKDLPAGGTPHTIDIIVQFKDAPADRHHRKITDRGGQFKRPLGLVNAGLYSLSSNQLDALSDDPEVAYISPDRKVKGSLDYAAQTVGALGAHNYNWVGTDIGIAIIDSGVINSYDFSNPASGKSRIVYRESFDPAAERYDDYGHGSHVAGIAAGNGASSSGAGFFKTFRGVAPGATIIDLRALDRAGVGTDSRVIAAIDRAIALKKRHNIRVINLSLGRPVVESYTLDPLCQAAERAWKSGIVVVAAAGNRGRDNSMGTEGYGTIESPGNDPYVITVGALRGKENLTYTDDEIASYSSKGPAPIDHVVKPDLAAPGNRIAAVDGGGYFHNAYPANIIDFCAIHQCGSPSGYSQYFRMSGTSMATPMVSGSAALLLQKDPSLTPDMVKARLMKTANKGIPANSIGMDPATGITYVNQHNIFTVGAGYLNVHAALFNADLASGTALSPKAVFNPAANTVSLVFDNGVVWGTGLVWGTGIVWGTGAVSSTGIVWGTGVVWGTGGSPSGTGVVWGTGIVWGTGLPAGEASSMLAII